MKAVLAVLAASTAMATSAAVVNITADASKPVRAVPNLWKTFIQWDPSMPRASGPWNNSAYPFIEEMEFFTATGGCYAGYSTCADTRDLFIVPSDPSSGVNASLLLDAVAPVLASGVRPYVVLANVPVALSAPAQLGGFGVNKALPSSLPQYAAYIGGIASAAVARFGLDAVRSFRWGVFTEFNNQDWLNATAAQALDLYDWTGCALEGVLGAGHVTLGTHLCPQCTRGSASAWESTLLLDHVVNGTNACTGGIGAPMAFATVSFYESSPGVPGDLSWVPRDVLPFAAYAAALGLDIELGIDEGRLLSGRDGNALLTRAVGHLYQGSWDAAFFMQLVRGGFSWYARWGVNTGGNAGLWDPAREVDTAATNVARMCHRMANDTLLASTNTTGDGGATIGAPVRLPDGSLAPPSLVDGAVSIGAGGELRVLVTAHHPWMNWTADVTVNVAVCGLPAPDGPAQGVMTLQDAGHGDWWSTWLVDRVAHNVTSFVWSPDGEQVELTNATDRAYFASRVPAYQALSLPGELPVTGGVAGGCLTFSLTLGHHAVALVEFNGVAASAQR